jgi:hypothetical protein
MPTGIVTHWNGSHGYIAPDETVATRKLSFSRKRLMQDYTPQVGDEVSFGLNPGARRIGIRFATYVAKIEETAHVDQP